MAYGDTVVAHVQIVLPKAWGFSNLNIIYDFWTQIDCPRLCQTCKMVDEKSSLKRTVLYSVHFGKYCCMIFRYVSALRTIFQSWAEEGNAIQVDLSVL